MHKEANSVIFSPTDLSRFMESPFASWMDRFQLEHPEQAPAADPQDPLLDVLADLGQTHEAKVLANFVGQGRSIETIAGNREQKFQNTVSAIRAGCDVIAQASLRMNAFAGYADFLVKVPGESALGDFHYEVWDAKLSSSSKPAYLIQLACYAEMLAEIQQGSAEHIVIALGNGENDRIPLQNCRHYYQQVKTTFLATQNNFQATQRPDPAHYSNWANWSTLAERELLDRDHLFQVAGITQRQIGLLEASDINTLAELASRPPGKIEGVAAEQLERLHQQAAIQFSSRGKSVPDYQILNTGPIANPDSAELPSGLALLPPHSPLDVFFDIEGNPLHPGGLEYLWGASYFDDQGERCFIDFWAHDAEQEKHAFAEFIHWVFERWQSDPAMHIYHYANYEIAACRKLMSRYAICEHEVDQLLRNEVFVDLYKIVKAGVLLGEPAYSIKNVEHLYRPQRSTAVATGGDSIVVYENWRALNSAGAEGDSWQTSAILNSIRDYNIDDCDSTQELTFWLRERQQEHGIEYTGQKETVDQTELPEAVLQRFELRDSLLAKAEAAPNEEQAYLQRLLAWSLEFHVRENKPVHWRRFDRLGHTHSELLDDLDCLANCHRTDAAAFKPTARARNLAYSYRFNPQQNFKGSQRSYFVLGQDNLRVTLVNATAEHSGCDFARGRLVVTARQEPPSIISLIPDEFVNPDPIPAAIARTAQLFVNEQAPTNAIADVLLRKKPGVVGSDNKAIINPNDKASLADQITAAVKSLNNSYLVIQGPPGTGKSTSGAHIIAELMRDGARVGIASNSHKAINHLLLAAARRCARLNVNAQFACSSGEARTDAEFIELGIRHAGNSTIAEIVQPGSVVGTTAWGFSRPEMENALDYLIVDEAGQVSMANLIAMSQSADKLILLGDQQQLAQPLQGSHPGDSGLSVLDYLLRDAAAVEPDMGVFLGTSYRMHSALNEFISDNIYASKLKVHPDNDRRHIDTANCKSRAQIKNAGLQFVAVHHQGNQQASDEEVQRIVELSEELKTCEFVDGDNNRPITLEDILFVAPYNHQVNKLQQALGPNAKVGSVDKFQGQQAPIVILSMCTSDANNSPRGVDFLFDRQRMNVALSRAQCLAIMVANPALALSTASSVEQVERVNLFCAAMEAGRA